MDIDDAPNGWQPDPFGRFDERYIVYGEPSRLVRLGTVEQTDRGPLSGEIVERSTTDDPVIEMATPSLEVARASSSTTRRRALTAIVAVCVIVAVWAVVAGTGRSSSGGRHAQPSSTPRVDASGSAFVVGASPTSQRRAPASDTTRPAKRALAPALQWTNNLLTEVDNVYEVAVDDGYGTLERLACQRAQRAARAIPKVPRPSRVAEETGTTSALVVTFASGCAENFSRVCPAGGSRCAHAQFGKLYRESLHALDALQAQLTT